MAECDIPAEALKKLLKHKDVDIIKKTLEYFRYATSNLEKNKLVCTDLEIIMELLKLTSLSTANDELKLLALDSLINISSTEEGATAIFDVDKEGDEKSLSTLLLIKQTLDQKYYFAECTANILTNMTIFENIAIKVAKVIISSDVPFQTAFQSISNKNFNPKCNQLSQCVCQLFGNLAQSRDFQKYLLTVEDGLLFSSILPVINNGETVLQKRGLTSTLYNCMFNSENHLVLLNPPFSILTYLLYPLAGPEEFDEDEVEKLPIELQYLESDKEREKDAEVRRLLLKSLLMLCDTKSSRELLRDNQAYLILREYHKWEKDPSLILACENVVDILIRTEDEIGVDNLKSVNVPDDLKEKFEKMDADFINS